VRVCFRDSACFFDFDPDEDEKLGRRKQGQDFILVDGKCE
jgi:hypothetical protein